MDPEASIEFNSRITFAVYAAYSLLLCACVIANLAVMLMLATHRKLWTVTNMLVANLAIGGLIMGVPLFVTPHAAMAPGWLRSNALCKTFAALSIVGVLVTSFTLASIALHRYVIMLRVCVRVSRMKKTLLPAAIWCLSIWIAAVVTSLPLWWNAVVDANIVPDATICTEHWENPILRKVYTWTVLFLQFVCPATVMTVCHIRIYVYLRGRANKMLNRALSSSTNAKLERLKRRRRVHQVLMLMVLSYIFTWLPWNVIYIVVDQFPELLPQHSGGTMIYLASHFVAMTSAVLNPLLYALCRQECREKLFLCFLHACCHGSSRVSSHQSARNLASDYPSGSAV